MGFSFPKDEQFSTNFILLYGGIFLRNTHPIRFYSGYCPLIICWNPILILSQRMQDQLASAAGNVVGTWDSESPAPVSVLTVRLGTVWPWANPQFLLSLSLHMSFGKISCHSSQEFKRRIPEINSANRNANTYSFSQMIKRKKIIEGQGKKSSCQWPNFPHIMCVFLHLLENPHQEKHYEDKPQQIKSLGLYIAM